MGSITINTLHRVTVNTAHIQLFLMILTQRFYIQFRFLHILFYIHCLMLLVTRENLIVHLQQTTTLTYIVHNSTGGDIQTIQSCQFGCYCKCSMSVWRKFFSCGEQKVTVLAPWLDRATIYAFWYVNWIFRQSPSLCVTKSTSEQLCVVIYAPVDDFHTAVYHSWHNNIQTWHASHHMMCTCICHLF